MFEELWSEINDAPGEIFDIPEMKEFTEDKEEESFDKMLNLLWNSKQKLCRFRTGTHFWHGVKNRLLYVIGEETNPNTLTLFSHA